MTHVHSPLIYMRNDSIIHGNHVTCVLRTVGLKARAGGLRLGDPRSLQRAGKVVGAQETPFFQATRQFDSEKYGDAGLEAFRGRLAYRDAGLEAFRVTTHDAL